MQSVLDQVVNRVSTQQKLARRRRLVAKIVSHKLQPYLVGAIERFLFTSPLETFQELFFEVPMPIDLMRGQYRLLFNQTNDNYPWTKEVSFPVRKTFIIDIGFIIKPKPKGLTDQVKLAYAQSHLKLLKQLRDQSTYNVISGCKLVTAQTVKKVKDYLTTKSLNLETKNCIELLMSRIVVSMKIYEIGYKLQVQSIRQLILIFNPESSSSQLLDIGIAKLTHQSERIILSTQRDSLLLKLDKLPRDRMIGRCATYNHQMYYYDDCFFSERAV